MKKITTVLLALALALAIVPAAMASPMCVGGESISAGSSCSLGNLTFSFQDVLVNGAPGSVTLSAFSSGVGANTTLDFTRAVNGDDYNLVYSVTGYSGWISIDNAFTGTGSIDESACSAINPNTGGCMSTALAVITNNTGIEMTSALFSDTGTFYISKDINDLGFSEYSDSTETAPEPSSLVMLGTGLAGAAFLLFRRKRTARAGSVA